MNKQEIFDTVAKHLFSQGQRAMMNNNHGLDGEYCAYRGENGMKCAVGVLIPDDMYDPDMDKFGGDGTSIDCILHKYPDKVPEWFHENSVFLESLQDIHDSASNWVCTEEMKHRLSELAEELNLNNSVLSNLSFNGR